mmetsp:Transcript_10390/g.31303  ORF Transcript_10390/g.31303 Transcript_10390/m.31303 type:complete len:319 (-) Transcript_10390:2653-3609(-)
MGPEDGGSGGAAVQLEAVVKPAERKQPRLASAISGSVSGAVVSACVQPLDVLRTRMQADAAAGSLQGVRRTMRTLFREGGLKGLWRGTGPTVWRLSLGAGLHFTVLDVLKNIAEARRPDGKMTGTDLFLVGGLSRAVVSTMLCPVTLVKTRMEWGGGGAAASGYQYKSTLHALVTIVRQERVRGLFRGVVPTVATNAPFSALYYLFYKQTQSRLSKEGRSTTLVNGVAGFASAVAATVITQPTDGLRTRMQLGLSAKGVGAAALFRQVFAQEGTRTLMAGAVPRIVKRSLQTTLLWVLFEELSPRLGALQRRINDGAN